MGTPKFKRLEKCPLRGEIPTMTTTADDKKRVVLRVAKPGDRFDVQVSNDGSIILRRLEPVKAQDRPAKVTFVKEGRFTVGVLDRPINEAALKEALAEFP
ncbi:MAG: hypothetical protein JWQ04_1041 [Pedosphaera sp.]|nr:hypothetical protein [Pedosphaera sp.]